MPTITVFEKWRQEEQEFDFNLDYKMACLKSLKRGRVWWYTPLAETGRS